MLILFWSRTLRIEDLITEDGEKHWRQLHPRSYHGNHDASTEIECPKVFVWDLRQLFVTFNRTTRIQYLCMIMLQFSLIGLSFGIPSNFSWGPLLMPPYPSFIHVMCIDRQSSTDARQVLRELRTIGLRPAEIEEVEHDEKGETSEACILYYPPDRDPNPILETGLENWKFEDVLLKLDDMKFMKWVKFLWGGVFFCSKLEACQFRTKDRKKQEPQKLLPQDFEMLYRCLVWSCFWHLITPLKTNNLTWQWKLPHFQ